MAKRKDTPPSTRKIKEVLAPEVCSLIDKPELCIQFFNQARNIYASGNDVTYNLSQVSTITETFAAVLISFIKDRNINKGKASKITPPIDDECNKKLKRLGIFKKIDSNEKEIDFDTLPTTKLTDLKVANTTARELVNASSAFLYGKEVRIKELYALLIEIMANTNNHAASDASSIYPWWLYVFSDPDRNVVKYVFLDLGIGIFNSIPVKQFMIKNPYSLVSSQERNVLAQRGMQLSSVFSELVAGNIRSSTGLPSRGRGIPLVSDCAQSGHFSTFIIISNDAYIDVISHNTSAMNEHFSGSLFYFELQEHNEHV
jgi:hypothetical protein